MNSHQLVAPPLLSLSLSYRTTSRHTYTLVLMAVLTHWSLALSKLNFDSMMKYVSSSVSSGDPTHTYSDPTIERPWAAGTDIDQWGTAIHSLLTASDSTSTSCRHSCRGVVTERPNLFLRPPTQQLASCRNSLVPRPHPFLKGNRFPFRKGWGLGTRLLQEVSSS